MILSKSSFCSLKNFFNSSVFVTLIINNFRDDVKGMASLSEFSVFKNESEILVFPLSCFEIKNIEDRDGNKCCFECPV